MIPVHPRKPSIAAIRKLSYYRSKSPQNTNPETINLRISVSGPELDRVLGSTHAVEPAPVESGRPGAQGAN